MPERDPRTERTLPPEPGTVPDLEHGIPGPVEPEPVDEPDTSEADLYHEDYPDEDDDSEPEPESDDSDDQPIDGLTEPDDDSDET